MYGVNFKVNARLMNDITINENVLDENGNLNEGTFREWVCKKKQGDYYQGIFEGNKHVIRGIYIRDGGDKAGFFSQLYKGEVRNLGIEDSYIASSQGRCGGICGQSWASTINNCYFIGVVKCGGDEVGGISSLNEGILSNCFSICKLTSASGKMDPVCRVLHKPIENCYGMYMSEASGSELRRSFENGEVAYLLQEGQTEHVWGQKIGVDKHPVFDGNKVYACTDSVLKYSNHVDCGESHVFDHCVCTYCGYRDTTCACEHVYDNCVCTYCGYRDTTCICEHVYDQCVCTYCGYRDTTCICEHVYVRCICIYCGEANHDLDHCVCKVCGIRDTTCVCEHELDHCVCIYCGEVYHEFDNCYCVNCKARDITCTNHEHRFENCYCVCGEPDTISDCWFNIYTVDDLYKFAEIVYGVNCKVNARLMNDITINENVLDENGNLNEGSFREWVCKKKNGDYYQGIFEGNKHVIRGIYIEDGGDRAGFFSQLYKGEVRNLGIEDSYIASSRGRCGGICGQSWESTINNCYFIGVVKCGGNEVGGISSSNEGILSNCFSICKLTSASGKMDPVCRVLHKPIENCYGMYMSEASGSELRRSFESGEVAYLLQNGQTEHVWGQKIGVDKYPVFDGDTVYGSTPCPQSFSNTQSDEVIAHDLDHCVCKACGFRDTTCVCEHVYDHCVCIYCGEANHEFDNCYCVNCKARDITCTNHEHRFENCYCVCGEPDTISDCWFNIYTVEDFYEFARIVNDVNPSQNARLMNDIVLNEGHQLTVTPEYVWNPSNYCLAPWPGADSLTILDYFIYRTYSGVFDGQNHVIRGLCGILELGGIIQYMDGGEIRNVGFEDAFLSGCGYSAIVAEASNTKFTNCYVTGNLFAYGDFGVASLAAHSKACSFEGCYNLAKIICPGSCAGITCAQDGAGDVSINRCWNAGDVISQYGCPSGLVSFNLERERERPRKATCSISNSYNLGKIETYRINFGGSGIVSFDALDVAYDDIYLENCYNAGIVSGEEHTDADPFCATFDCCLSHVFHFSNCYYLDSCVAEGNILHAYPDSLDVHAMSAEQFANGEVCYRLNKGVTDGTQPFYQNLNEVRVRPVPMRPAPVTVDPYPVLDNTHLTVYTDGDTYFNYKTNVGIEQISDDLSNPLVYVVDRTIYVCNVEGRVLLSDMNGRILFSQKVQKEGTSSCAEIPVRDAGAYLLVVNGAPCKVVAR